MAWFGWTAPGGVEALYVAPAVGGAKAGVHAGDRLERIEGVPIERPWMSLRCWPRLGSWSKAKYRIRRGGVEFDAQRAGGRGAVRPRR